MEAKLFVIRCSINQATYLLNIKRIVIILDSIHAAKRIFDSSIYPYQIHLAAIFCELRKFFRRNIDNSIEFWDCSSCCNQGPYLIVNTTTFLIFGKYIFKPQMTKDEIFLNFVIMICRLSHYQQPRVVHGLNILDI